MKVKKSFFGLTPQGEEVYEYELSNNSGFSVRVISYGGIITEISAPDKSGTYENVVLGFDSLEPYIDNTAYFGCTVGRHAGRISNAAFELNGSRYDLAKNDKGNSLHGGIKGFSRVVWNAEEAVSDEAASLVLRYSSPDMEEGFPGKLDVEMTYMVEADNSLSISYRCNSDKDTIFVPTNHSYFNLSGNAKISALSQRLRINASRYIKVDPNIIPIEISNVDGSPFDLREGRLLKESMDFADEQISFGKGYDHPFIFDAEREVELVDEESGRRLLIESDEPCVVFYSGGYIGDNWTFRGGKNSKDFDGICLETQWYTDSMNKDFPKRILRAGETFETKTKYSFSNI